MPTVEDFRLQLWAAITEAKDAENFEAFMNRVDTFATNCLDQPAAYDRLQGHIAATKGAVDKNMIDLEKVVAGLDNELHRNGVRNAELYKQLKWRMNELYGFIFKLADDYHLFPDTVSETRTMSEKGRK